MYLSPLTPGRSDGHPRRHRCQGGQLGGIEGAGLLD